MLTAATNLRHKPSFPKFTSLIHSLFFPFQHVKTNFKCNISVRIRYSNKTQLNQTKVRQRNRKVNAGILNKLVPWLTFWTDNIEVLQGRRNEFQSRGAMEHWKVLLAIMVGWQEIFWILDALEWLKQWHFDLSDSLLLVSALKLFYFPLLFFFLLVTQKIVGGRGYGLPLSLALF